MVISDMRRICFLLIVISVASGCQSIPLNSPMEKSGAKNSIAVVPSRYPPESNFATFARNYKEGAAKGAGEGIVGGAATGASIALKSGDPIGILLAPVFAAVGAVVGGIAGVAGGVNSTVPAISAQPIDQMLDQAVADIHFPELAAQAVVEAETKFGPYRAELITDIGPTSKVDQPDYRSLASRDFGSVIEVRISSLGFKGGGGSDPEISLFMTADARLIDVATGKTSWIRGLGYMTPRNKASFWAQDNSINLRRELELAYKTIGERIVESFVLSAEMAPLKTGKGFTFTCGLIPTNPEPMYKGSWLLRSKTTAPLTVNSLTPTLSWHPMDSTQTFFSGFSRFPKQLRAEAKDVRYDLRIWRRLEGQSTELVYERIGLLTPDHQLELTLEPHTEYLWSIRPRFTIDGHPRAMRWSAAMEPPFPPSSELINAVYFTELKGGEPKPTYCTDLGGKNSGTTLGWWTPCFCLDFIPQDNYFRFKTP